MAQNITFTSRGSLRRPLEMSNLLSFRESQSIPHNWKNDRQSLGRDDKLTQVVGQLQRQVNSLSRRTGATSGMHPFKIYNYPKAMRTNPQDNDWQKVKVHFGLVQALGNYESGRFSSSDVLGDDGAYPGGSPLPPGAGELFPNNLDAYNQPFTTQNPFYQHSGVTPGLWDELIVPADGNLYHVWISLCPSGGDFPVILLGKSPSSATSFYDGSNQTDVWPTYPVNDPYHILIGWCVIYPTSFLEGLGIASDQLIFYQNQLFIHQVVYDNLYVPSWWVPLSEYVANYAMTTRFRGTYSGSSYYYVGDTVLKVDDAQTPAAGQWLKHWVYYPGVGTLYPPFFGPIIGIDPPLGLTNADPWVLLSATPISTDYVQGAFNSLTSYIRIP